MSRQQFRLLVVFNQLLFYGTVLVQGFTDAALPEELLDFVLAEPSLLDGGSGADSSAAWWAETLFMVTAIASLVASVGLCFGRAWGRRLFLVCFILLYVPVVLTPVYVDTGWTILVGSLNCTTTGMILALVYFSHLKRMFDGAPEAPDEDEDADTAEGEDADEART